MQQYKGKVVYVEGKPFGIAERLSPSVKLFAQDTGRWSQTGPPRAQLPVKMRKLDAVDPGTKQLGYDLSNAELRIVAELSGDDMFLSAFAEGWDLHSLNACELFGMDYPPNRIKNAIHFGVECEAWRLQYEWQGEDDARRKFGKIFNFRTLYGGSPKTAYQIPGAGKLGLTRAELEQAGYRWLAAHPKLNAFWEKHGIEAMQRYCVRNIFGRRRVLCSADENARHREGINHPIQSHISDLINCIVVKTFIECNTPGGTFDDMRRYLIEQPSVVQLVGQCHDSLLWAFPEERFNELANQALDIAESPMTFQQFTFQIPCSYYVKGGESEFQRISA